MLVDNLLRAARDNAAAEDWNRALHLLRDVTNLEPDRPEALYLMGETLRSLGYLGLAQPVLAKALSLEQRQPNLWMVYGSTLHDLHQHEAALEAFAIVKKMLPRDSKAPANASACYVQTGQWRKAIEEADAALAIDPNEYIAKVCKGFALLSLGRWSDAWTYAEALYGTHLNTRDYGKGEAEWDGTAGKALVVNCDQGLGDQIMFAQCLPELIRDSKQIIVECSDRMVGFFKRNFPALKGVYGTLKEQSGVEWPHHEEIDARVHLSFLGRFYRRSDKDFPRAPYIAADPTRYAKWRAFLDAHPKPWTGIAWRGGIQATQTHSRSLELPELAPILEAAGGTLIDLSYHDSHREVATWNLAHPDQQIIKPPVDLSNYEDTIALIAALDDVVTVTTTVAHVCGALGRHAYVMTPSVPTWRYAYRAGDDGLIWYPKGSVSLYRQVPGEDWAHAINRVATAVRNIRSLRSAA